jgi:hypothetical protein
MESDLFIWVLLRMAELPLGLLSPWSTTSVISLKHLHRFSREATRIWLHPRETRPRAAEYSHRPCAKRIVTAKPGIHLEQMNAVSDNQVNIQ